MSKKKKQGKTRRSRRRRENEESTGQSLILKDALGGIRGRRAEG
jgi:hypothetical protein